MPMTMRLDYLLANGTTLSRKAARREIMAGQVLVDGIECRKAATHVSVKNRVTLAGEPVYLTGERYLMLNKPADVVSATKDGLHKTAIDLLPGEYQANMLVAGRLDRDTTGLLLLTTDGQWSHRVTSPKTHCPKTYRVELAEPLAEDALTRLREGLLLRGETRSTRPAVAEQITPQCLRLTISEGRYHQIKRMLAAVGNHVEALHRERIGAIALDEALASGEWRELSDEEIGSF
jgi:16S rRNA pseudouridine516 synthase